MRHRNGTMMGLLLIALLFTSVSADGKQAQPQPIVSSGRDHGQKMKRVKVKAYKAGPAKAPVPVKTEVPVPKPTVILTPKCPDEYEFVGKECVSRHEIPERHVCPPNTVEEHGVCRKRMPGALMCPHGFQIKDKMCVQLEEAPMVNQCPHGSFPHGGQCVVKLEHAPHCPEGTARIGDRCARFTPMIKDCPAGYTPRGDLCATQVYEDPDSVCPTGTFPDGNVCKLVAELEEKCPPGTVDTGDRCASYTHRVKECPKGYSMNGKACVRQEIAPKMPICPNGGDPDENCVVSVPVPASPYCRVGKLCTTGQCVKTKRTKPHYTCPPGYDLGHGGTKCTKVTTYDCTKTHSDIECEQAPQTVKGATYHGVPHVRHRMLGVDQKGKYQNVHYSKVGPVPKCQKKAPVERKTCEKVHTATAEAFCDAGEFKGTHCEMKEYFAPEMKCDAMTDSAGNCYVEERSPLLYVCPTGYTKTQNQCTRTEITEPHFFCPPGTVEPNCATYVEKMCPHGGCQRKIVESPKLVCPEGFHTVAGGHNFDSHKKFGHKGHGQAVSYDGPKCTKTMFTDKMAACPRGTVHFPEGMKCASFVDISISKTDKKLPMQHLCPLGYEEKGGKCIRQNVIPAEVECPHETINVGFECLKSLPQVAACPHGAIKEHGRCWAMSYVSPIMIQSACSYDVSPGTCRGQYNKGAEPKFHIKKTPVYKRTKHYGGPVQRAEPVRGDGKSQAMKQPASYGAGHGRGGH